MRGILSLLLMVGIFNLSLPVWGKDMTDNHMKTEVAIFAAGCFWCVESEFQAIDGVVEVVSGYIGGTVENPDYEDVLTKKSGHYEAVSVFFDPEKLNYDTLLDAFWKVHNPTQTDGQGIDIGPQYRSAIFVLNDAQRVAAEASLKALSESGRFQKPIATKILPAGKFYPAEEYHQDYYARKGIEYPSVFTVDESKTIRQQKNYGVFKGY